jgi:chaperonin GroEL (HSP60 family)
MSHRRPRAAGTTTATVLTRAILGEGCKSVAAGMNPMDLRRGINLAVEHVVDDLKRRAKMISTTGEIAQARLQSGHRRRREVQTASGSCMWCTASETAEALAVVSVSLGKSHACVCSGP